MRAVLSCAGRSAATGVRACYCRIPWLCNAMRCNAMRCNAMRCDAMRCDAMRCDAMECDAIRCVSLGHVSLARYDGTRRERLDNDHYPPTSSPTTHLMTVRLHRRPRKVISCRHGKASTVQVQARDRTQQVAPLDRTTELSPSQSASAEVVKVVKGLVTGDGGKIGERCRSRGVSSR